MVGAIKNRSMRIDYKEAQSVFNEHPLRSHEVPLEDYVSLAMPTDRWATPAWAWFSCPAERNQNGLMLVAPDRVWAFAARGGELVVYATGELMHQLLAEVSVTAQPVPPIAETIPQIKHRRHRFAMALDEVSELFFSGRDMTVEQRQSFRRAIDRAIPPALTSIYHKLAPDFFAWLNSADGDS